MTAGVALRRAAASLGLAAALLAGAATAAAACPSCKAALDTSDRWQTAFNASVLFMMSMPFAVVAVVAGAVYRANRRKRRGEASENAPPAA
jgi:uncharacterized transporter YbjL